MQPQRGPETDKLRAENKPQTVELSLVPQYQHLLVVKHGEETHRHVSLPNTTDPRRAKQSNPSDDNIPKSIPYNLVKQKNSKYVEPSNKDKQAADDQ